MKFLCYEVYSRDPEEEEPVSYCIMGDGKIWTGSTLELAKAAALQDNILVDFIEDCGWVLEGEENFLLEQDYQDILLFTINMNHPDLKI